MSPIRRGAAAALAPDDVAADSIREFAFSEEDFQIFTQLAYEHAGISLSDSKRNLVYSRLSRRLRALRLETFRDYYDHLAKDPSEVEFFINSISTNHTKFFREVHHFEHFRANVAAPFARGIARGATGRLRIWSAGCSTGEEPYTIALVLKSEIRDFRDSDVRILATDIDTEVLAKAARAEFSAGALDELPESYHGYFSRKTGEGSSSRLTMDGEICSLITFGHLNLMGSWPFQGMFDAIFCRNVMIYFDTPTKANLIKRFTQQLKPGGWLYIGHSESLIGAHPGLQLVGRTTYRRDE